MRLFIALPVPKQVAVLLENWTVINRDKVLFRKWTHPSDYHITLQFLGDATKEQAEELRSSLREIKAKPFSLKLDHAGHFGPSQAPRIFWSSVSEDLGALHQLHQKVVQVTSRYGFTAETKHYAPHITIARYYSGDEPFSPDLVHPVPIGFTWEVEQFTLMQSHLQASPMYEIVDRFPLINS